MTCTLRLINVGSLWIISVVDCIVPIPISLRIRSSSSGITVFWILLNAALSSGTIFCDPTTKMRLEELNAIAG